MRHANDTQVLVVGAGPVGLLTALLLAEQGIHTTVIDKEERTATHSYACVLHPATLQLLDRLGLINEIHSVGHLIDRAAFYDGPSRHAEIHFSKLSGGFHYAVALPQSTLEQILERQLWEMNNKVLWNHRLADLQFDHEHVKAQVDKLVQTARGYAVADWDWSVQKRLEITATFVVGADGYNSIVRSRLGIEYELIDGGEQFAVVECGLDHDPGAEVRIVVDDTTTNVVWPMPQQRCRWTFQLRRATDPGEFPLKDRERLRMPNEIAEEQMKRNVERLCRSRAPWFKEPIKNIEWAARVGFEHRLVKSFGTDRTWLVGDAAHQTCPVGGQSMNEGLLEADALVGALKKILSGHGSKRLLNEFNDHHKAKWERLLNKDRALHVNTTNPWLKEHAQRILYCLPSSGEHFSQMMAQLGYDFDPAEISGAPVG